MKFVQRRHFKKRYSVERRAANKSENAAIRLYDMRLLGTVLETLNADSVDSVLEIGCGYGTDAAMISKYANHIVAVDVSRQALKNAMKGAFKTNLGKVAFISCDVEFLPLRRNQFDLAFCKDLLHHVPDPVSALREMKHSLKDGGKVVAVEANAYNPQMALIGLMYFSVDKGVFRSTKVVLLRTFKQAGLLDIGIKETEYLPRAILFEYRSPLCKLANSGFVLSILSKLEDAIQNLSRLRRFANYLIVYGVKKTYQ